MKPGGLALSDRELRDLLVTELELVTPEDFDKAAGIAQRRRTPIERAVAEQAKLPFLQLLHEIGRAWGVPFIDLKSGDVRSDAMRLVREVANLVTKHAAVTACRAAIVVLPDDPAFYEKVPVNKPTGGRKEAIDRAPERFVPLLAIHGVGEACRRFGVGMEGKGQLFEDDAQLVAVASRQRVHGGLRLLAVRALEVRKLDQRDERVGRSLDG